MTDDWKSDAVDHQGRSAGQIRPRDRKLLIRLSGHLKKDSKEKTLRRDIEDDICGARFERAAAKADQRPQEEASREEQNRRRGMTEVKFRP